MIEKERLEELIRQGATVYFARYLGDGIWDERLTKNHFIGIADGKDSLKLKYNGNEEELIEYLEWICETKEEAEEDAAEWNEETDNADKFEVVEITMAEGDLEKEIVEKDHRIAVLEKALELACEDVGIVSVITKVLTDDKTTATVDDVAKYYIDQAEKELEDTDAN